jgi:hypothetical protein
MLTRDEAAKKLGILGRRTRTTPTRRPLKAVQHQALLLLNRDPEPHSIARAGSIIPRLLRAPNKTPNRAVRTPDYPAACMETGVPLT